MEGAFTDRECVRRILRGDVGQFSRLVSAHGPRMMSLAISMLHRRDVAEDVVQEAFVKAYEKLHTWRGDSALSTWLHRIVYTTAVSSMRGPAAMTTTTDLSALNEADDDGDWTITEDNIAQMRRAVEMLSPHDCTLVTLFYLEERSVRDVATICGESESNIKTRLHRTRARLKKMMTDG
jgi:RNA polymerase sigma-70 factor (ECF subfamily)